MVVRIALLCEILPDASRSDRGLQIHRKSEITTSRADYSAKIALVMVYRIRLCSRLSRAHKSKPRLMDGMKIHRRQAALAPNRRVNGAEGL